MPLLLPSPDLDNLLPWVIQISAVSLLGTLLPMLFGVRHPKAQLAYGYAVLLICLLLPVIQPKQIAAHPVQQADTMRVQEPAGAMPAQAPRTQAPVVLSGKFEADSDAAAGQMATSTDAAPASVWREWRLTWVLFWVLVAGAAYRLGRLAVGASQIRRYRVAATPLYPVPDSVVQAMQLTRARAVVCLSADVPGPATLGLFRPVILLPPSFLSLPESAQQAVVCHELLHVRRRDWALAMIEGVVSALLWFSPVAWLISEIRLAREQLVDAEVVRLTSAKEPYIRALLDIARGRPALEIVPAPLFIRRRHLTARVQLLLDGAADSFPRLSVCYATISALLVAGGWMAVALFPLAAMPQAVEAAVARMNPSAAPSRSVVAPIHPAPTLAMPVAAAAASARAPEANEWAEPIVGAIATASSPSERAAVLALLERAKQNSSLHIPGTPPFHLEVAFEASGQVADVGNGEISETWMSGQRWRWTAMLGGYSQIRIGSGQTGFDVEPGRTLLPMRVHMLRRVVFAPVRVTSGARLRLAAARVNGTAVTCVLLGPSPAPESPVRLWQEDEYCVDDAGLLRVHSPALGAYTRFDYARPLRFGGRVLPGELRSYVGGVEVVRARLTIRPAGDLDDALFTATPDMVARGASALTGVAKAQLRAPAADLTAPPEIVVVHAAVDPSGVVLEAEVAAGDPQLAAAALEIVRARRFASATAQRDFYVGVNFGGDYAIP